ncbi:hypothetical protein DQQ10_05980 [Pseudochryseolinea flava]|uniref:Uncharacterized protein n=1 Tax=Pseudochryseolinea flava TaxID=2059302 RepID=A0A364Y5F3_9BACT|nr:hypothetical protein DQQ10_05980 [Pseudochryseolinea flava]
MSVIEAASADLLHLASHFVLSHGVEQVSAQEGLQGLVHDCAYDAYADTANTINKAIFFI